METEEFNQDSFEVETENAIADKPKAETKKNERKSRKNSKKSKNGGAAGTSSKIVTKKEILISSDSETEEIQNDPDYVPEPAKRRTRSSSKKQV